MRKFLMSSVATAAVLLPNASAVAADVPVFKAPAPAAVVAPNWTGFFIGFHGGASGGRKEFFNEGERTADFRVKGWLGGLQAGYNHQIGNIVVGVEGQFSWSDINDRTNCFAFGDQICTADVQWIATAAGRIGGVFGSALLYVKGGAAWVRDRYTNIATCAGNQPISLGGLVADCGVFYSGSETRSGWVVGGGIEYLLSRHWSVKVEYNHLSLGTRDVTLTNDDRTGAFVETIRQRVDLVKAGINYRFDFAAPAGALTARAQAVPEGGSGVRPVGNAAGGGETILLFTGTDIGKKAAYGWGGAIIAATGTFDVSGPRLFLLGGGGRYKYPVTGGSISGDTSFGDVLGGWGFESSNYTVNLLAGFSAQHHSLSAPDPTNTVQGTEGGVKVRADAHVTAERTMAYGEIEYATPFETFFAGGKFGYDVLNNSSYFGPIASYFRNERSNQWRIGAHVSQVNLGPLKLNLVAGYLDDSIVGRGGFGRIELSKYY